MKGIEMLGAIFVLSVVINLVASIPIIAEGTSSNEIPEIVFEGDWGTLRIDVVMNLDPDKVIELAYMIRNITYDLLQWEIGYNVTSAKVQMELGDQFLAKAINLSSVSPKRSAVYGFVAIIHYSHSTAFANSVIAKIVSANLDVNDTISNETVKAVISVSEELRDMLIVAINYAKFRGYNTTVSENTLFRGDVALDDAKSLLNNDSVLLAFKYAICAYRTYVRAYHLLLISVLTQTIKDVLVPMILKPRVTPAQTVLNRLPAEIRNAIRAKVMSGEIKGLKQIVKEIESLTVGVRARVRLAEKENLKHQIEMIIEDIIAKYGNAVAKQISNTVSRLIDEYFERGHVGVDLVNRVLYELRLMLEERRMPGIVIRELPQPRTPRAGR